MAFGAGVLISALSFELMIEALDIGGFGGTALGFLLGASVFTAANAILARYGARNRKRSGLSGDADERIKPDSGLSIAIGSMFDNIPESVAIGLSMVGGEKVSTVTVIAVFLSNVPEALSAAVGLRNAGRSAAQRGRAVRRHGADLRAVRVPRLRRRLELGRAGDRDWSSRSPRARSWRCSPTR